MTTSPLPEPASGPASGSEIERTFGDGVPMAAPPSGIVEAPLGALAEWRRFGAFLKRPVLPAHPGRSPGKLKGTLRMLWLDLPIMGVLIAMLSLMAELGVELPENINSTLEPSLATFALIALVAPLLEEFAFRSWLNGLPWLMALVGLCAAGVMGVPITLATLDPEGTKPSLNILALVFIAAGVAAAIVLRKRPRPAFFEARFALFFWVSSVGFALIHLANYSEGALALLLVLVLPQFALGTMLGYLRVHYGLMPAITLHAAHNAILFSLAMASGGAPGEG
ncbi:MAG: CPBP family glutamic-type intramembrane protease [Pseudomonadota bacterium]